MAPASLERFPLALVRSVSRAGASLLLEWTASGDQYSKWLGLITFDEFNHVVAVVICKSLGLALLIGTQVF